MTLVRAVHIAKVTVIPPEKFYCNQMLMEAELHIKSHSSFLIYHFVKYLPPVIHQLSNTLTLFLHLIPPWK